MKRMTPHRQLLADYAESGSEEAFRQLVDAYIGMVHGAALRLVNGNRPLAEDIAQTVFTDLARQAKTLSPEVLVGGWLHRRTCYAVANVMRSEQRRLVREREAVEMNSVNSENPDEALAAVAPVLDEAINQLSEEDRAAIMWRFFERWNMRAIGESLGTTEAAAQKRVERALEKLRVLLSRRGIAFSATAVALTVGAASATAAPAGLAASVSTTAIAGAHASGGFSMSALKIIAMTKLKATVIVGAVALLAAGTTTTIVLNRDPSYTPPPHMRMYKVRQEAQADTAAGRYKDAQAKFIWYRDNALKYEPSEAGVRDSFALTEWADLAQKYPPAMRKLNEIRDQAIKQLHDKNADAKSAYIIATSINLGLKERQKDLDMFKWLDKNNPNVAKEVYSLAEMELIDAGEYAICGRYLDPDASYKTMFDQYKLTKHSADMMKKNPAVTPSAAQMTSEFADKFFSNEASKLVAVLALNNRYDDAARIADEALNVLKTPEFETLLADAKDGKVPARYP